MPRQYIIITVIYIKRLHVKSYKYLLALTKCQKVINVRSYKYLHARAVKDDVCLSVLEKTVGPCESSVFPQIIVVINRLRQDIVTGMTYVSQSWRKQWDLVNHQFSSNYSCDQ